MAETIETLEARLQATDNVCEKIDLRNELAWKLRSENVSRCLELTQQAQALVESNACQGIPYQKGIADSLRNLAGYYHYHSDFVQATTLADSAIELYEAIGDLRAQFDPLAILYAVHIQLGNYSAALETCTRRLEICEILDDYSEQPKVLNSIGVMYSLQGQYQQALTYYDRVIPIYEANSDMTGLARLYNNYLVEYQKLADFEKALDYGLKSLSIFEETGNQFGQSRIHGNLNRIYAKQEDFDNAFMHGNKSIELAEQLNHQEHKIINSLYMGQTYTDAGQYTDAISYLDIALNLADQAEMKLWQYQCHRALAQAYKGLGQYDHACNHFEQFHILKEALTTAEGETKLQNLEIRYRTQVAQQEAQFYRERSEELEVQREQDRQYFERLSEMKDEVLRTASHDLKSPLSTLSMLVYVLKGNSSLDDDAQQLIDRINKQIERMRDFVIGVLDLAKLETGRSLSIESLPMVHYLKSIVEDYRPDAEEKQISLTFSAESEDIVGEFDPVEIRRVIENLLSNAIKFTSSGRVELSVGRENDKVVVSVSDTGLGIPPDAIRFVFDRFYRVESEAHRLIDGSGIGLAIAKTIVDQHNGEIWVESENGKGSTFNFTLQLAHNQSMADETA